MPITIATACIHTTDMDDPRNVDITIKSAPPIGRVLAPLWPLVAGSKHYKQLQAGQAVDERWRGNRPLSWDEYTQEYLKLLRSRYGRNPRPFLDLLDLGDLTLCCYCRPGDNCHRHLAAGVLAKIAVASGLQVTLRGEIQ